ncbi:MAG: translation initiation factor IF-2, partial [Porphyromonadaceae bacterium]|nr:translation initiation factor IF-2 [Porphyromonadaceae bacterium]
MPKDIKLFTLAKELNVGIGSFKDSLEKKNVLDVNTITPNTRVPREVAEQLIAEHGKGMGKAEIAALLDTLSGAAAKPAPAKPAAKPETPAAEPAPAKVKHIETVVPEDRRPSLNIKGSIATEKKAEPKPAAKAKAEPKPAPAPKAEAPAPEVKPEPKVEVKPEPK